MSRHPFFAGKTIFLVSHELTRSGAPMLLVETAKRMQASGASVSITSLVEDLFRNPLLDQTGFKRVEFEYSFLEASKADLVLANTAVSKTWIKLFLDRFKDARRKLTWWIHELSPDESHYGQGLFRDRLVYFDQVKCGLFDSHGSKEMWRKSGITLPSNAKVVHPYVTDKFLNLAAKDKVIFPTRNLFGRVQMKTRLNRRQVRKRLGLTGHDFLITLIGTYLPKKGHDLLADTVNRMVKEDPKLSLKLLLIGFSDIHCRNNFLNTYSSSAISSKRTLVNVEELHGFYRASDCYVMNSQQPGECFGRVTIEAMAHKLPVLGTNAGGTRDIIEHGVTGLLHPVGKEGQQALKDNILRLYENRSMGKEMGKAGFARVNRLFREERFFSEFCDAIQ